MVTRARMRTPVALCLGLWACGTAELGGAPGQGLAIVDAAPPPAVATEPYAHELSAENGSGAVRWSINWSRNP